MGIRIRSALLTSADLPMISSESGPWYCCGRTVFLSDGRPEPKLTFSCGPAHDFEGFHMRYGSVEIKPFLESAMWVLKYRAAVGSGEYLPVSRSRPFVLVSSSLMDALEGNKTLHNVSAVIQSRGAYIGHIVQNGSSKKSSPVKPSTKPFCDVLRDLSHRVQHQAYSFSELVQQR